MKVRKISPARARKLRKRGESVQWYSDLDSWGWIMTHKYANRWSGDTTKFPIEKGE